MGSPEPRFAVSQFWWNNQFDLTAFLMFFRPSVQPGITPSRRKESGHHECKSCRTLYRRSAYLCSYYNSIAVFRCFAFTGFYYLITRPVEEVFTPFSLANFSRYSYLLLRYQPRLFPSSPEQKTYASFECLQSLFDLLVGKFALSANAS